MYKDGLHLLEVGKKILANNFIVNLNNFFSRYAHTPSTNIFMNDSDLRGTSFHERLKHNKNPVIGYLNINSLRNKLNRSKSYPKVLILRLLYLK